MPATYGLVVTAVFGIGTLVHFSRNVEELDEASVVVVRAIFSHGFEVIGAMVAVLSALSLLLTALLTESFSGWEMPATALIVGTLTALLFSVHIGEKNRRMRAKSKKR